VGAEATGTARRILILREKHRNAITDHLGRFRLHGVFAERCEVAARGPGWFGKVLVHAGARMPVDLPVVRCGAVTDRVVGPGGEAAEGVRVVALRADREVAATRTGDGGRIFLPHVPVGTARVVASTDDGLRAETPCEVTVAANADVGDLRLHR